MTKVFHFAIVGLGRAGRFHLASMARLDSCCLKYVVDPQIDSLEGHPNVVQCLNSIDPVLEDDQVDAVVISTPTQFHFDYICKSLQAGKHVFTEKPLGKTVEQISTCFDLAAAKGLALYLGFQRRYDKNFIELKRNIDEIGQVRTIKISSRDNPKPSLDYLKISGNIFHDMLIHDFDMLQFLLGDKMPTSIFALGHSYDKEIEKLKDYDTVLVTLQYEDGLICSIDTSRISVYGYDQRIELFAESGMAIAENERNNTVEIHTPKGSIRPPINHSFPQRYKDAYMAEIKDFVEGIRDQKLNNISKKACIIGHMIADAAYDSCYKNEVVKFKERLLASGL